MPQKVGFCLCLFLFFAHPILAQTVTISLDDLSSFKNPGKSWGIAGEVEAEIDKVNKLNVEEGQGILVNLPTRKNVGEDLITNLQHGDLDLEFDFMMARGSNSGIYLQGLYEVQLLDSWGSREISSSANGGIYERWDESRPAGQKGFQGYSPRQNVSRAPGLWQHMKISFQAPRFDGQGNKIENAKILRVELNGVVIHEGVELFGPTRGALSDEESDKGPLRFQGDHGAVAFRNINYRIFDKPRPKLKELEYSVYEGIYEDEPIYDSLPPEAEGTSVILTSSLRPSSNQFLIRYKGILDVAEAGDYSFNLHTSGGSGLIRINNKVVINLSRNNGKGTVNLPQGEMPFELIYSKYIDWREPGLGLFVSAPALREYLISDENESDQGAVDPILVDPDVLPVVRSFMDLPDGPRLTHAMSISSSDQLHYTYDLNSGSIIMAWRGEFLDATPMWHERGDGSSRPRGSVVYFTVEPELTFAKFSSATSTGVMDTTGAGFRQKGYKLNDNNQPTFLYNAFNSQVEDAIQVLDGGTGLKRTLSVSNPVVGLVITMAKGRKIEEVEKSLYLINQKYYIKVGKSISEKPVIIDVGEGEQELIIPAGINTEYSIIF